MKNLFLTLILLLSALPIFGQWQSSQEIDEFDDSKKNYFAIPATIGENQYGRKPILMIRQIDGEFDMFIVFGEYLSADDTVITIRFDKEQPYEDDWSGSSANTSLFCPTPNEFIKKLLTVTYLKVRCSPYSGNKITAIFDVSGLDKEFNKFGVTIK